MPKTDNPNVVSITMRLADNNISCKTIPASNCQQQKNKPDPVATTLSLEELDQDTGLS